MKKRVRQALDAKIGMEMNAVPLTMLKYIREEAQGANNGLALHRGLIHMQQVLAPKVEDDIRNYYLELGVRDVDVISGDLRSAFVKTFTALGSSLSVTFQGGMSAGSASRWATHVKAWIEGYAGGIQARTRVAVERQRRLDPPMWQRVKNHPWAIPAIVVGILVTFAGTAWKLVDIYKAVAKP